MVDDAGLSDDPSDDDIRRTNLFSEPLVLVGGTSTREANRALANAIHTDLTRGDRFNTDALEAFLRDHPRSPWRASLQLNLGILHRQIGRYRSALDAWEEAWALTRDGSGEEVRALADRAVSELALLHAQLGRRGRLDELQAELRLRPPLGPAAERYARAQIGRATMEAHPERAYRCGPFALTSVWTTLHPGVTPPNALLEATSSMNGTSLSQLAALAARAGEPMRALRRAPGTPWTAPSVVHWRVDHFAALVAIEVEPSGRKVFVLRDPTFGGEVRTTERWLEEEASGHVLVPSASAVPEGWHELSDQEAGAVWGRGETSETDGDAWGDEDATGDCEGSRGMARYRLLPHLAALRVEDTPAWLSPAFGPAVDLRVIYHQADWNQPQTRRYTNFGGRWTFSFGSMLESPLTYSITTVSYGGGGVRHPPPDAGISIDVRSGARLEDVPGNPDERRLRYRDGSTDLFRRPSTGFVTRWYLVERRDPQGNAVTLEYNAAQRLNRITAASGETLTFHYRSEDELSTQYYLVSRVALGDGREATFGYKERVHNGSWILSRTRDMAGMDSEFMYTEVDRGLADGSTVVESDPDFLAWFDTPYGRTSFTTGWGPQGGVGPGAGRYFQRWVEVALPTGDHERVEYRQVPDTTSEVDDCSGLRPCRFRGAFDYVPPSINTALQDNADAGGGTASITEQAVGLNYRNSYHWRPIGYARGRTESAAGPVFDPRHAHVYHWAHQPNSSALTAALLESEVPPGESRITYAYQGQLNRQFLPSLGGNITWFRPMVTARLTRDADPTSDRFTRVDYGPDGNPRQTRDSAGRLRCLTWAANQIDLLSIHALPCSALPTAATETDATQRLVRLEYEGELHRPTRVTDAAGQVTRYVYNRHGQVLRVVRPDLKTVDTQYDQSSAFAGSPEAGVTPTEGRPLHVRFPTEGVTTGTPVRSLSLTWHPTRGTLSSATDAEGVVRGFTWDEVERLLEVRTPDGRIESYDYRLRDAAGQVILGAMGWEPTRITTPHADTITRSYDGRHRLIRSAVGTSNTSHFRYNVFAEGRFDLVQRFRTEEVVESKWVTRWSAAITPPGGMYEEQGPVNAAFQPRPTVRGRTSGELIGWAYDHVGRLRDVSEETSAWHLEYRDGYRDSSGVLQPGDGLLARVCDATTCTSSTPRTEFGYEPHGGDSPLAEQLKRLRYVRRYETLATFDHERELHYVPFGVEGASGVSSVRESSVGDGSGQSVTYGYDVLGRLTSATRPTIPALPTETLTWHYDDLDRLARVTSSLYPGQDLSRYLYAAGQSTLRPHTEEMPVHGCQVGLGFALADRDFRAESRSVAPLGSVSEILRFQQSFRADGRLQSERVATGTRSYNYDDSGRVMWADDAEAGSTRFRDYLHSDGNSYFYRLYHLGVTLLEEQFTYNFNDRAHERVRSGQPTTTMVQDGRGRVTFDGDQTYSWDANNRLTQVARASDGATWQFRYDGSGRLRRFQEGGLWHRLVWVDGSLYSEYTGSSEWQQTTLLRTYHADGMTQYAAGVGTRYRFERDARGSIRAIVRNGQVAHVWRYDPWGNRDDGGGAVTGVEPRRGFAGYVAHADTGLLFTPARVYQPALRRWLTRDPLGERDTIDGNNLYEYAAGDPVNLIDPTGQWVEGINAQALGRFSDYMGGVGDAMTFGFSGALREVLGIDGEVDECSGGYAVGQVAGEVVKAIITSGATTAGSGASGLRLYHGTDGTSALNLLRGAPLDVGAASANKIDGTLGFFLATERHTARFFAFRRSPGGVLSYQLSPHAVSTLGAHGAGLQNIPAGAANLIGQEFFVPPSAFDVFNSLRSAGHIVVTPL